LIINEIPMVKPYPPNAAPIPACPSLLLRTIQVRPAHEVIAARKNVPMARSVARPIRLMPAMLSGYRHYRKNLKMRAHGQVAVNLDPPRFTKELTYGYRDRAVMKKVFTAIKVMLSYLDSLTRQCYQSFSK
jgi:hypothetical protein